MRKRRVEVTARSRQIVGSQATGFLQVDTEIAAPLELRTPMGTAAQAASECGWKHGDKGAGVNRQNTTQTRGNAGTSEASLPFPPTQWFCIVATRQGYPDGSLALGLDGSWPRCENTLPTMREWQAMDDR